MTFVNLKHFKEKVAQAARTSDRSNPIVKLALSKDAHLSFRVLIGMDGQVHLPVESKTIKDRSQLAEKSALVPVDILNRIVKNLPILLEEINLEFIAPGLVLTGEYGNCSVRYELHNCQYLHKREYDTTEEKVVSFSTDAGIASVLLDAAKLAQKASSAKLDNLFLSCKEDEILVSGTDGHSLMQKYVYAKQVLDKDIDLVVSSELATTIGKFAFQVACWEIYQNFVRVVLDDSVEIFATRPLLPEFPNFQQWDDKSCHAALVVDANELKARLNKCGKDVWLWFYTVENRLAIECFESDSVGVSWVKNTLKVPPALIILNGRQLLNTLKTVKKGTSQIRFLLPVLVAEDEFEDFFNNGHNVRNVAYLEFDKNSHLIAGGKKAGLPMPPGVRDWLIARGWSILPESKPVSTSTAAKSAVKILSDRWTGKGWERPELVECECGAVHDESTLQPHSPKYRGYCDRCEDYLELALHSIDYRCLNQTCNTLNEATTDRPLPEPICMNCGKKEFRTRHYFECQECERPVEVNDCKACYCDAILEDGEPMWQCADCEAVFFAEEICDEEDLQYLQETEDGFIFVGCPCCERFDTELTSSPTYSCFECGSLELGSFYIPAIEAPALPCPECNQDLSDIPPQTVNDPFVVGDVVRF